MISGSIPFRGLWYSTRTILCSVAPCLPRGALLHWGVQRWLISLCLNVAGKLHTLQRPGAACVALGPVPNVALVVCVLTHETDVACVALG